MPQTYFVTGGAGFIGSHFVTGARRKKSARIINLDALTYAGNLDNLLELQNDADHIFVRGDIGDAALVRRLLAGHAPDAVIHFAAESHVDRSILDPEAFIRTNVLGTATLLRESLSYWEKLPPAKRETFRFLHVSTDEVFGSLQPGDAPFSETTAYAPKSPYSASKAGSDHLARAFYATYGLPVLVTNCSNNYGPRQFPEKLIPLMILNAFAGEPLPVYGQGVNIRDWLHVEDHCAALNLVLQGGKVGETYLVGGRSERNNLDLVNGLCSLLDELAPTPQGSHKNAIRFVTDRPGHDLRYAINPDKIEKELHWRPEHTLESGLRETVNWYLAHREWVSRVKSGEYRNGGN
ncbi:dTDP-glucose 4,6-dehydratase [Deltaproteobacteria bacterium]|nr:dTDP-glucose 4,6-dehydratase [Deltaproteobacteria bacterium]